MIKICNTEKSIPLSLKETIFPDIYAEKIMEVSFKLEFHSKFIFGYNCWKEMELKSLGMGDIWENGGNDYKKVWIKIRKRFVGMERQDVEDTVREREAH
jgi:hypothetical protein